MDRFVCFVVCAEKNLRLLPGLVVLFSNGLYPTLLLRLELVVEEEEGFFVVAANEKHCDPRSVLYAHVSGWQYDLRRQSGDDKHPLSGVIVSSLGDADFAARESTDLVDFRSA